MPYPTPPPAGVLPRNARKTPAKTNKWTPWLILGGMGAVGLLLMACMFSALGILYLSNDRVAARVTVSGVDVGGKTLEAATAAIQQNFNASSITLSDGERKWLLSLNELGVTLNLDDTSEMIQQAQPDSVVQPVYDINLNQTQDALVTLSDLVNIPAQAGDAPQMGRMMEIPVMLDRLRADVVGELADGIFELNMIEVEPPVEEVTASAAYNGPSTTHVVQAGQELALIAREYGVTAQDIISLNNITNPDIIWVGQELLIPASGEYTPSAAEAPPAPTSSGKSIVVSTQTQRIYAYENGQLVRSHLTSTGRNETPTVLGDYKIYVKHVKTNMRGPDYFLPDVPYTMYFYAGYGIHGTYWHNSFGRQMSHGCVNLPIQEAEWFFNWAEVGTTVRVV